MIDRGPEDDNKAIKPKPQLKPRVIRPAPALPMVTKAMKPKEMHRMLVQHGVMPADASQMVAASYGLATSEDGKEITWKWQEVAKLLFVKHMFTEKLDIAQDRFTITTTTTKD